MANRKVLIVSASLSDDDSVIMTKMHALSDNQTLLQLATSYTENDLSFGVLMKGDESNTDIENEGCYVQGDREITVYGNGWIYRFELLNDIKEYGDE